MSSVRHRDHYHFVTLPSGRRVRSDKQTFDDIEIGTGWSFGKLRVTTSDVAALRNAVNTYVDSNNHPDWSKTWLATHGGKEQASNIQADALRILKDDKVAASYWATMTRDQRNWMRNKFNPKKGILRDIASVATTAAGTIAGGLVAGPIGAAIGAKKGAKAGKKFSSAGADILAMGAPVAGKVAGTIAGGPVGGNIGSSIGNALGSGEIDPASLAKDAAKMAAKAAGIDTSVLKDAKKAIQDVQKKVKSAASAADVKKIIKDSAPTITQVKQAIQQVRDDDSRVNASAQKIAKVNAPVINKVVARLQKQALQQQATSEHKSRNKVNKIIRDNNKKQDAIINEIRDLKSLVAGKTKAQQTVAAAFGVPLVYTV